jgi:SOS response regulatory protein OraA/RecX
MNYLEAENQALRKELTELLELTIVTNQFLEMVLYDIKQNGEQDDAEYVALLIETSSEKINKLKALIK